MDKKDKPIIPCPYCEFTTTHKGALGQHVKHKHKRRWLSYREKPRIECPYCDFIVSTKAALSQHIKHKHKSKWNKYKKEQRNQFVIMAVVDAYEPIELNITISQLEKYKSKQQVCEICGKEYSHTMKKNGKTIKCSLAVDHCHETNRFRGLLCVRCNSFFGFYDQYEKNIKKYIEKANKSSKGKK